MTMKAKQTAATPVALLAMMISARMGTASTVSSSIPISTAVSYSCKLHNLWNFERHPTKYPQSAHWTPPVMVAHSADYVMWQSGSLATPGMEQLAEIGGTSTLIAEINRAVNDATERPVRGRNQFDDVQTIPSITVTPSHHLISVATMAGPSPDWFTGFSNFDARDIDSGTWWEEFVLETYPWDAGTEKGSSFSLSNDPESPHIPIFQHTLETFPNNGQILPVASFTCSLEAPTANPNPAPTTAPTPEPTNAAAPDPTPESLSIFEILLEGMMLLCFGML